MTKLEFAKSQIESLKEKTIRISREIWEFAELAFEEKKSAALLINEFKAEGFDIKTPIADMDTAFTASFGSGGVRIGILGEYDALAELSQKPFVCEKDPINKGAPGHGCGHNMLGAGGFAAAVAIKNYIKETGANATVIYFGCPAEEGAGSKQFIAREGCFDDIDVVYTWHPGTFNEISSKGAVAIMGANFEFKGTTSHAGASPHLGRSALDAAELMNIGVNYLREHMIDAARVHYAYGYSGTTAPNVVPDHATLKYEVRAPKVSQVQDLFSRVVNIAKGAALMTDTKVNYEVTMAFSDYLANKALARQAQPLFEQLGAPNFDEADFDFARKMILTYNKNTQHEIREALVERFSSEIADDMMKNPLNTDVLPFDERETGYNSGSTDVGDVGYAAPTLNITVATQAIGNVGHTWQNTSFSNSEIGNKGMIKAAEIMTLCALDIIDKPEVIKEAKKELLIKNGGSYSCPLPAEATPPIGRY